MSYPPEVAALVEEARRTHPSMDKCDCPPCRLCRALLALLSSPPAPVEPTAPEFRAVRWIDDPADPNWRLRVESDGQGLASLTEEKTTSTSDKAQVLDTPSKIIMTPPDVRWLHATLGRLLSPPAPVEDDGLDALIAEYDGGPMTAIYTAGDLRRWLRELQARRRGER